MLENINTFVVALPEMVKTNPVLAAILGAAGVGTFLKWGLEIPSRIFGFISRRVTTSVTIHNINPGFYTLMHYVSDKRIKFFQNSYVIEAADYHSAPGAKGKKSKYSPGLGSSYCKYKNKIIKITRVEQQAAQSEKPKESVTFTYLGRDTKIFDDLIVDAVKDQNFSKKIKVLNWDDHYWQALPSIEKRSFDTVVIEPETLEAVKKHLQDFNEEKDWCLKFGIPWRTGLMLEGPPGTGKTSLIAAICSEYNMPLYLISSKYLIQGLQDALAEVPEGSVVAIEDIDSAQVENRDKDTTGVGLSGALNSIDGLSSGSGRIIIATTNHIVKLDSALIRPGRFDLIAHIGYMTDQTLKTYLVKIYGELEIFNNIKTIADLSPAKVQALVKRHKNNPEKVLKEVTL